MNVGDIKTADEKPHVGTRSSEKEEEDAVRERKEEWERSELDDSLANER